MWARFWKKRTKWREFSTDEDTGILELGRKIK